MRPLRILLQFGNRLRQLHVREVNAQSKHDPLALEAVMASRRVASLIPQNVPIILESRVAEPDIQKEMDQRRPRARQHRGAGDCRRLVASPGYGLLIFLS